MGIIPYGKQDISDEDIASVVDALKSDFLTQGPQIKQFEEAFSKYVGSKYAVAVSSATAGLHLSMMCINRSKKKRVITSPITFAATANCVRYLGGEVWFADIDPNTYLIDIDSVEELILSKPIGFFEGLIVVDFAGLPINLEKYRELCNKHGLWLIEDACHAPGGSFKSSDNKKIYCGSGEFADASVFSFHPVKHIACGEGGMITTNSKSIFERLKLLRSHGISKNELDDKNGGWYYQMKELGYNYRITDIQSALGFSQLKKSSGRLKRRNEIAQNYKEAFKGKLKFQFTPNNVFNAYHLFVVELINRKEVYDLLRKENIFSQVHYIPVYQLPYYKKIGYSEKLFPNAENYYKSCLSLPMFPSLKDEEQRFVIEKVLKFANY